MINLNDKKLELDYPCNWEYKLIVLENCDIKKCAKDILLEREYNLKLSKTSSKSKFKSYTLQMLVHNEDERKEIFSLLGEHKDIKMVL